MVSYERTHSPHLAGERATAPAVGEGVMRGQEHPAAARAAAI